MSAASLAVPLGGLALLVAVCGGLAVCERHRAGPTLVSLGRPRLERSTGLLLAGAWAGLVVLFIAALVLDAASRTGRWQSALGALVTPLWFIWSSLSFVWGRWRVTALGLSSLYRTVPWREIESCTFESDAGGRGGSVLTLSWSRGSWGVTSLSWWVPGNEARRLARVLSRHLTLRQDARGFVSQVLAQ